MAVICSDPLLTEGILSLLTAVDRVRVCVTNGAVETASRMVRGNLVDALVVTTGNVSKETLSVIEHLRKEQGVKIVAVSNFADEPDRFESKVADAVMSRDTGLAGLRRSVAQLERTFGPVQMAQRLVAEVRPRRRLSLTRRENDVVKLVAQGKSNRQIADALGLREQSVKNLVSAIMRKLNCENRVQLALHFTTEPSTIAG